MLPQTIFFFTLRYFLLFFFCEICCRIHPSIHLSSLFTWTHTFGGSTTAIAVIAFSLLRKINRETETNGESAGRYKRKREASIKYQHNHHKTYRIWLVEYTGNVLTSVCLCLLNNNNNRDVSPHHTHSHTHYSILIMIQPPCHTKPFTHVHTLTHRTLTATRLP